MRLRRNVKRVSSLVRRHFTNFEEVLVKYFAYAKCEINLYTFGISLCPKIFSEIFGAAECEIICYRIL